MNRLPLLALPALFLGCFAKGIDPPSAIERVKINTSTTLLEVGGDDLDPCGDLEQGECPLDTKHEISRYPITVESFCVDQHEVTNEHYRYCVAHGACSKPRITSAGNISTGLGYVQKYYNDPDTYGDHPVIGVSWSQAAEYCEWMGGRLPREYQLEYLMKRGQSALWRSFDEGIIEDLQASCQTSAGAAGKTKGLGWGACSDFNVRSSKSSALDAVYVKDGVVQPGFLSAEEERDPSVSVIYDLIANASEWAFDIYQPQQSCSEYEQGFFESEDDDWMSRDVFDPDLNDDKYGIRVFDRCLDRDCSDEMSPVDCQKSCLDKALCLRIDYLCTNTEGVCPDPNPVEVDDDGNLSCANVPDEIKDQFIEQGLLLEYSLVCEPYNGANKNFNFRPWCSYARPGPGDAVTIKVPTASEHQEAMRADRNSAGTLEHAIKGASYLEGAACDLRASRRRFDSGSSAKRGFRCVYELEGDACPAPPRP